MKVVCLLGSPRVKGNSATIARHVCEIAEQRGADIQVFILNKMSYKGCQGCMKCKTELERCILEDDLTSALDAVRDADALILATPVYIGEVTSQLKTFIDRTFSYFVPDHLNKLNPSRLTPGKKLVFIQTQGNPDETLFNDIFPRYERFFKRYGFEETHLIRACGVRAPGEVEGRADLMRCAEETARKIIP